MKVCSMWLKGSKCISAMKAPRIYVPLQSSLCPLCFLLIYALICFLGYTKWFGAQAIQWDEQFSIPKEDAKTIWTPGPNFPCINIILTPNSLFQITISKYHPIIQEPLWKILEKLLMTEKISLYFVMLEANFNTFTAQNYRNEQWKVLQMVQDLWGYLSNGY